MSNFTFPISTTIPGRLLADIVVALAVGMLLGLERQWAGKDVGLRTFAFCCLLGVLTWKLGLAAALVGLGFIAVLITLLNVHAMQTHSTVEITTSVALFVTTVLGMLIADDLELVAVVVALLMAALLSFKEELAGFTVGLSRVEVRSAIVFGIIMFVIYPILPTGYVDPLHLVNLRQTWLIVILISAIGFLNYILLRRYGVRGMAYTGVLGGLVNSFVTVAELASRATADGELNGVVFRGMMLATAAMFARNWLILAIIAPPSALYAGAPLLLMLLVTLALAVFVGKTKGVVPPAITLKSPFSLRSALSVGLIFLGLTVTAELGQRSPLGASGLYAISFLGGLISSSSSTASAATLAQQGQLSHHVALNAQIAAIAAILASLASAVIIAPLVLRLSKAPKLNHRVLVGTAAITATGLIASAASVLLLFGVIASATGQ